MKWGTREYVIAFFVSLVAIAAAVLAILFAEGVGSAVKVILGGVAFLGVVGAIAFGIGIFLPKDDRGKLF